MNLAISNAIALALSEQNANQSSQPSVEHPSSKPIETATAKPIDIRRSFNGLRVGLPLISAALCASDSPDDVLSQMMDLIKKLSSELLDDLVGQVSDEDMLRKAALVRTVILKSVEAAAISDRLEDIDTDLLTTLINQSLELALEPSEFLTGDSNFDVQFLVITGLTASTFVESNTTLRIHLHSLLEITHKSFGLMLKHNISPKQLKIIEQSFLTDVVELYKRIVKVEHRKYQIELIGSGQDLIHLPSLIEKHFQVYLKGVIDAAISNSEVTK